MHCSLLFSVPPYVLNYEGFLQQFHCSPLSLFICCGPCCYQLLFLRHMRQKLFLFTSEMSCYNTCLKFQVKLTVALNQFTLLPSLLNLVFWSSPFATSPHHMDRKSFLRPKLQICLHHFLSQVALLVYVFLFDSLLGCNAGLFVQLQVGYFLYLFYLVILSDKMTRWQHVFLEARTAA